MHEKFSNGMPGERNDAAVSATTYPVTIHISMGGPTLKISVNGKILSFEDHPYCGPTLLKRNGDPAVHQPSTFLNAVTLWYQQGKRLEDGLCRWDTEPQPITKHMGGRRWKIIGYTESHKGR